jgi:hypothetical protein
MCARFPVRGFGPVWPHHRWPTGQVNACWAQTEHSCRSLPSLKNVFKAPWQLGQLCCIWVDIVVLSSEKGLSSTVIWTILQSGQTRAYLVG